MPGNYCGLVGGGAPGIKSCLVGALGGAEIYDPRVAYGRAGHAESG